MSKNPFEIRKSPLNKATVETSTDVRMRSGCDMFVVC